MKLEFLKKPMEYLRPVLRETRQIEETAEAIIPDSCPDIQEMLISCGSAFLRGKDVGEGTLAVSVGVSAAAMTQPEGRAAPEEIQGSSSPVPASSHTGFLSLSYYLSEVFWLYHVT